MMIQNSYTPPPGAPLLQAMILDEIARSQASQVVIDELGLAMATHPGFKRDRNEDRIAVARIEAPNTETYTVALVCDGVGGSESGDQAAALAITSIIVDLAQQQVLTSLIELATVLVRRADELVRKELQGRGTTTLVMLLTTGSGHLVCANIGDSRAYSWDPSRNKLNQVTIDDTIENELKNLPGNPVALIKARGLQGRLSQAIGEHGRTTDELRIQTYTKEHFLHGAVLSSDGLWRVARDFETVVANTRTPIDAVRRSIALANWVGGVDNSSLIVVEDLERLCGSREVQASDDRRQMEITLWVPSAKIKIFTNDLIRQSKSPQARVKSDKVKRRAKKKDPQDTVDELQLKLDTAVSNETRPKIQVMINEKPKQDE